MSQTKTESYANTAVFIKPEKRDDRILLRDSCTGQGPGPTTYSKAGNHIKRRFWKP